MSEVLSVNIDKIIYRRRAGDVEAVKDVHFTVKKGEYVVITGAVGSGKSSLLYSLNGAIPKLIPNSILEGEVNVMRRSIADLEVADISKSIGLVLEDPDTQLTQMTVEDDLAFGPSNMGLPPEKLRERVEFAVKSVRLGGLEKRNPRNLSGGQKQAVAIGGVLSSMPDIVALDEPISMLDPIGKTQVLSRLRELNRQYGVTVIVTDSGMEVESFADYADRVMVMSEGRILKAGTPHEILTDTEVMKKSGLRLPQVTELCIRMGASGPSIPVTLDEAEKFVAERMHGKKMRNSLPSGTSSMAEGEPVVVVKNLRHTYPGLEKGIEALRGVSFTIRKGEFVALIGQNGSGKSTLALHLVGILKPTNRDALVEVAGLDAAKCKSKELIKQINYVYQNPDDQIFCEKVQDEISFGLEAQGLAAEEIARRTAEALSIFGLERLKDEYIVHLDRGRRTYTAISSIMALKPDILIIDEPTTGLDEPDSLAVMRELQKLTRAGKTVIAITHNMNLAAAYAEHIIVMHEGTVLLDGTPREVFAQSEVLSKSYIVPPQITQLGQRLKPFGFPADILSVDEMVGLVERA
ncbi:energy-coupling factor transporter ATPase [Candidatus Bathyarchaeota archaeon]|nr:energy-coupling factor transporter ATPase [Candidatus Bathyarchaeota archaeon]